MDVRFWGTRGSIATPGVRTLRYGGNTSCVQVTSDSGTLTVLDCGTGARELGDNLIESCPAPMRGHIFLTHTHWDHIQGFPFFAPAFNPENEWVVYGPAGGEKGLEMTLAGQMQYTYFPVELENIGASLVCRNLTEGRFQLGDIRVRSHYMNHPALTLGYRLEVGEATFAYCTDHEPYSPALFRDEEYQSSIDAVLHSGDRRHIEFVRSVDLLVHDAQYTSAEYEEKHNWGHSSVDYVVRVSLLAGVKRLALYHHDPKHDDDFLDSLQERARQLVRDIGGDLDVFVAAEGSTIHLPEGASWSARWEDRPPAPGVISSARVLIVDDDPMLQDLICDVLEPDGYILDVVGDGPEALDRIKECQPDLVLLDARLPSFSGFRVLDSIRQHEETRDLPVIVLTGTSENERTRESFEAGAQDFMSKPFSPSQLRARVSEWLTRTAGRS